jgi:dihydrolipoamide dehydrogenase
LKILADAKQMRFRSTHDRSKNCDLIAEAVVAMEFKASAEDISRMSHASHIC